MFLLVGDPAFIGMNGRTGQGQTSLHLALESGDGALVNMILARRGFTLVNASTFVTARAGGYNGLHVTAFNRTKDAANMMHALLQAVSLEAMIAQTNNGVTPLHLAAS